MLKIIGSLLIIISLSVSGYAQNRPIKILDTIENNRIVIYATNENFYDVDILVTVKGTGFKQRGGTPRLTRVPSASRVKVQSLVIERGKKPLYVCNLVVNDSLSRRVLKPQFTKVKVEALRPIVLYTSERCTTCDTLISNLNKSPYKYKTINLSESLEKASALEKYVTGLDTITSSLFSLGGRLYTDIITYDQLLEKLLE